MPVRHRNGSTMSSKNSSTEKDPQHFTYSDPDLFNNVDYTTYFSPPDYPTVAGHLEAKDAESAVSETKSASREREERDVKAVGAQFASHTTAHGWGRVAHAHSRAVKVVWLCVTLGALTCSLLHISLLVRTYLSFNSEVKWTVAVSDLAFPSVSLCNVQPMSPTTASALLADPTSLFHQWYNITQTLDAYRSAIETIIQPYEYELLEGRLSQPIGYYENIDSEAQQVGHQSLDFILGCTFSQNKCSHDASFTLFQSAQYFNCYTFNGGDKERDSIISTLSGPHQGLSLVLYLENDNGENLMGGTYHTTSPIGNAAGVRVVIHAANTRPSPIDQGIDVPPGNSANLALSVKRYDRLNTPYGDCVKEGERDGSSLRYSRHACMAMCQQDYVIEQCGCKASVLPHTEPHHQRHRFCGQWLESIQEEILRNEMSAVMRYLSNILCESRALSSFLEGHNVQKQCECYPECDETLYNAELSLSTWPLEFSQPDFFDKYVTRHPNASSLKAWQNLADFNTSQLISDNLIGRNFVRVNVYLKSMTLEEHTQRESYRLHNLFSDIGGTCGLWIGMSIITWCEVVELLCALVYSAVKYIPGPFS